MSLFKNINWIIEPKYNWIDQFKEGLAPYSYEGKWGYIDSRGNIIIKPKFDQVLGFSEGLACVKINNKWGYINAEGRVVIEPMFDDIPGSFNEGLVRIAVYDQDVSKIKDTKTTAVKSKFGYADRGGKIVIEPKYRYAGDFSEGLADVGIDDKSGYINRHGKIIIDLIFKHTFSFRNNRAVVSLKGKWGIIENPLHNIKGNSTDV